MFSAEEPFWYTLARNAKRFCHIVDKTIGFSLTDDAILFFFLTDSSSRRKEAVAHVVAAAAHSNGHGHQCGHHHTCMDGMARLLCAEGPLRARRAKKSLNRIGRSCCQAKDLHTHKEQDRSAWEEEAFLRSLQYVQKWRFLPPQSGYFGPISGDDHIFLKKLL